MIALIICIVLIILAVHLDNPSVPVFPLPLMRKKFFPPYPLLLERVNPY
jgi:hypothetical protein